MRLRQPDYRTLPLDRAHVNQHSRIEGRIASAPANDRSKSPPNEGQAAPTRREMLLRNNRPPQAWFFLMFRFVRSHRGVGPRIRVALRLGQCRRFAAARPVEDSAAVRLGSEAGTQVGQGKYPCPRRMWRCS